MTDGFTHEEINQPHAFIQWKGTDVCMDFYCECGADCHFDGDFAYTVKCPHCDIVWEMPFHVFPRKAKPELGYWYENPKILEADEDKPIAPSIPEGWQPIAIKTMDDLPKKVTTSYEQYHCLAFHKGEWKHLCWNCEHLVWDDCHGDDYYCDALEPTHYILFPPAPQPPQSQEGDK